ncbi:MAG: fructosamine kinase family protein, partial [Lachnospiraceae bacterium]|nr:fructosamine kinase family protein [Lachnospiraceae bacterium]
MYTTKKPENFTSLEAAVRTLFGDDVKITGRSGISGGDINEALRLTLSDGNEIFMKTNSLKNAPFFTAEAAG